MTQSCQSRSPDSSFALILVALIAISCNVPLGRMLSPYKYVTESPDRNDIVGMWVPDSATNDDMRERGGYDGSVQTRLELREDGSFEMVNMPDWWSNGFGESHGGFNSGSGTWALDNAGGFWNINFRFGFPRVFRSVGLVEHKVKEKPRYYIEFILGDPDSGDEMIFVRRE